MDIYQFPKFNFQIGMGPLQVVLSMINFFNDNNTELPFYATGSVVLLSWRH